MESVTYALYQMEQASAMDKGPAYRLMRIHLINTPLADGIYPLDQQPVVTGLAAEIPTLFESGHIMLNGNNQGSAEIYRASGSLGESAVRVVSALETRHVVVYSAQVSPPLTDFTVFAILDRAH